MAVNPTRAREDAFRRGAQSDDFDDPTEDLRDLPVIGDLATAGEPAPGTSTDPTGDDPFEPGRVLCGRYQLERIVGRGGMSIVFAALDLRRQSAGDDDARVAIKALRPELRRDEEARRRLTEEFRQLQQLSHPGIVRVYDLDRHGGDWFLVMELLEGTTLAGLVRQAGNGRTSRSQALDIVKQGAAALGWAHGRGVVHGDVKPGNVFVTREDGVRLLDFGTATAKPAPGGQPDSRAAGFATPAYASPQVLQGREAASTDDVYSLACVAFELLAGVHPFDRLDAREAWARELRPLASPQLEPGLRDALEAGLSFDREQRPRSMEAFVGLLEQRETANAVPLPPYPGSRPAARGARSWVPWLAAAAVLAAIVAVFLWPGADAPQETPAVARSAPAVMVPAVPAAGMPAPETAASAPEAAGDVASGEEAVPTGPVEVAATPPVASPATASRPVRPSIGFAGGSILVSRSAPAAAVPVRRTQGSDGRAVVTWRIDEGSARAGRDFSGPLSGTLVLADGQEAGTVFVPLLAARGTLEDRRFSVVIDNVRGGARKGSPARVDVTLRSFILDEPRNLAARD